MCGFSFQLVFIFQEKKKKNQCSSVAMQHTHGSHSVLILISEVYRANEESPHYHSFSLI